MEKGKGVEEEIKLRDECYELLQTLPKVKTQGGIEYSLYEDYWYASRFLPGIISFQQNFKAHDTDLILANMPKSGTTWLKALTFSISNRHQFPLTENHPLLTTNPQDLIPFLENEVYGENPTRKLQDFPIPRILATHVPFFALPSSIKESKCRIIYLCRNPLDQFISFTYFIEKLMNKPYSNFINEDFDLLCKGVSSYGPFWNHILGYWKISKERPEKVLFLKYEDLKEDIVGMVKVLAKFMGCPFSVEEENQGVIEEISRFCSFDHLKDLEVNKTENNNKGLPNSAFFRKGNVGDWVNHLTPAMADRTRKLLDEKFEGSGLDFKLS